MRHIAVPLAIALAASLAACSEEASPTSPREIQFTINPGPGNRQFQVVSITAGNASHQIDASLLSPYMIFVENAQPPAQGVFLPNQPNSLSDVQMVFGGETVPRVVTDPSDNSPGCPSEPAGALCINSGGVPVPVPLLPEVRFDISAVPDTFFTANVGSFNQDHLISLAQTPASVYLEGPEEVAQGVFTKANPNSTLTVTLLIDGVARDTATSPAGSTNDAIVQYQYED